MYLEDVILIGGTFKEHLLNLRSVPAVPRSPHKAQNANFFKKKYVSRAYCVTRGDTHRPREADSCTRMVDREQQTRNYKLPGPIHITDDLFPVSQCWRNR
jgi:hypothetical protein